MASAATPRSGSSSMASWRTTSRSEMTPRMSLPAETTAAPTSSRYSLRATSRSVASGRTTTASRAASRAWSLTVRSITALSSLCGVVFANIGRSSVRPRDRAELGGVVADVDFAVGTAGVPHGVQHPHRHGLLDALADGGAVEVDDEPLAVALEAVGDLTRIDGRWHDCPDSRRDGVAEILQAAVGGRLHALHDVVVGAAGHPGLEG